jgi:hypothetical protein
MRDELRMAGWHGDMKDSAPQRLKELAEVEKRGRGCLAAGLADRLAKLRDEIATRSPMISEIQCVEDAGHLPYLIRCLLETLGARFACGPAIEAADPGTNLRLVQDFLRGCDISGASWNEQDESVVLASAFSEVTLAHGAVQLLNCRDPRPTLLATANAGILADTLNASATASPALDRNSPLRPVMQVLGLALEMRWAPPDPSTLLKFLAHSVCPVSRGLRYRLAEAVADRPGIGSKKWNDAIEACREKLRGKLSADELSRDLARIDRNLEEWIIVERYPRQPGAPGIALAETSQRVAAWARSRAAMAPDQPESRHLAALSSVAGELAAILTDIPTVSPEELSILLEQVTASGPAAGFRYAELGSPGFLANAGAAIEPTDDIVWWGFERQSPQLSVHWSLEERRYLMELGVHLPVAETLLALAQAQAQLPFLAARRRVVLLWPRQRGDGMVEPHPLLTRLSGTFPSIFIMDMDRDEFPSSPALLKIDRPVQRLPLKKRWIRVADPAAINSRPKESYSSLSRFALRPFEWVFHYKALLRRGSLMEINLQIQRGNLLHRVVEHLLESGCPINWHAADKSAFDRWLDSLWPNLLESEGANFLLPGYRTGGQRLLEDARRATWRLILHMREAGAVTAEADVRLDPLPFEDTTIGGIIDLQIKNRMGRAAIVDLKFGQEKTKRAELANNTALQLAVYGYLTRSDNGGTWSSIAYYILRSARLLAQDTTFFSDAFVVSCDQAEPGPASTWGRFLDVWRWRRGQLNEGWIEVPIPGTAPAEGEFPSSVPPHEEWQADAAASKYDDYQALTGWEEYQ